MTVIIFYATNAEVIQLKNSLETNKNKALSQFRVEWVCTGVGLMHATGKIVQAIHQFKPSLMLQVGIAGSFNTSFSLGESFVITMDAVADEGVWENNTFTHTSEMEFCKQPLWHMNQNLLMLKKFPTHHSITVNTVTTTHLQAFTEKYKMPLETMEGAALHWAGNLFRIPYFQVRGISNYVGERNKANWKFQEAITNSNEMALKLLLSLR